MNDLIIFCAQYLYLFVIGIAFVSIVLTNPTTRRNIVKLSLLAFPLSFGLAQIASHMFYNLRPFVVEHIKPLIPHAANNGFPSDHTLLVIGIASILFVYNKRLGVFLFILGLLVGFARVYAKVHHPIDILGSVIITTVSVYISWIALKKMKAI